MKRKVLSSFAFAALIGAGMFSVTSCADYDSDINAVQQQVDANTKAQTVLQGRVDGLEKQIKDLEAALNSMKSCQCGDVDQKIADEIAKALAGMNYATPEEVAQAISNALAGLNTGLTAAEVQNLIDTYHAAHPDCQCGDIQALIEKYLKDHPGLSEADVEAIVKAYHDAHPGSTLSENDVKSIVETYINQLQHFTKEQIEAMINTAITQALAGYVQKSDSYTKSQVEDLIAAAVKDVKPGLSTEEVNALIEAAVKNVQKGLTEAEVNALIAAALQNVKPGLSAEEVQALIDAAKCNCPALTTQDVTTIATTVIEKYMQEHPFTLDTNAVENICNNVINNSQVINNIKNSITTLQGTVDQVKTDLQNLKDNVYTKSEVENLINTLIAQAISGLTPNGSLSAEQQAIVTNLINTAINNYNAAHPDCNCQYDATAFQALVDAVAANTSAIQGLQPAGDYVTNAQLEQAIQAVKDLIPAAADLSNYVTLSTYNNDIVTINNAIAAAQAKAEEALNKANANGTAIEGLQTSVQELNDLYISLSKKLDDTTHKAEVALNRALSNYFEIEALKSLYNELKNKLDIIEAQGYDDTAIKERLTAVEEHLTTLDTQLATLATKEELAAQLTTVQGLVNDAKTYAESVANTAAAQALNDAKEYAKDYTDVEIGKVRDDFAAADQLLQNQINDINTKLGEIDETLQDLQDKIDALNNKFTNVLTKLITNIELQGSLNPAFGYYALPVGVSSNVLIAYYGENEHDTYFPYKGDRDLVYNDSKFQITDADWNRVGINAQSLTWTGGTVLMNDAAWEDGYEDGYAGKLYLTVNPSSVDFTGTQFKLVNSLGEESPIKLGTLKPSTDKLTFGQSRSVSNGFYEAPATLNEDFVGQASFPLSSQLTSVLEDVAKTKSPANLSNLAQAIYNQFNGLLDAYAVQATWTDDLGEHTVTSKYGIAATAVKPLSYNFMKGVSFKLPTITPLSELNIDLNDYIKIPEFDFDFDGIDVADFENKLKVEVHFSDVWVEADGSIWTNVHMTEYVDSDGEISSAPDKMLEEKFCLVSADGSFNGPIYDYEGGVNPGVYAGLDEAQRKAINAMITLLVEDRAQVWSAQLQEGFQDMLSDKMIKLVKDINKVVGQVSEKLEGNLSGKLKDMIDKANKKLNSALGKGDKIVNQLNKLLDEFNDNFFGNGNPNLRLQSHVFYEDAKGFLHPMSQAKGIPTIVSGDGEAIELSLTSYTNEILVPSFQKYVAVTNVYKDGQDADSDPTLMKALKDANNVQYFNEVFSGDHYAVAFHPTVKGATYEIVYSSLDYHGNISQAKYYVKVK